MGSIKSGTRRYRQVNQAFFVAGFITFVTLYDVQPLLPVFSGEFRVAAARASLPLSITTCALAVSMLFAGTISESLGRKRVMVASLLATSLLAILTSLTHTLPELLVLRLLQGIALAGLPAIAMAYLSEAIAPASLTSAIGALPPEVAHPLLRSRRSGQERGRQPGRPAQLKSPSQPAQVSDGGADMSLSIKGQRSTPCRT